MAKKDAATVEDKTEVVPEKKLSLLEINQHMHAQNAKLGDLLSVQHALCEQVKAEVKAAFERGDDVTKLSVVIAATK